MTTGNGKRKSRYFSEHQRQLLLSDKALYDYLRDRSNSEEIRASRRYADIQREIDKRRAEHIEYLSDLAANYGTGEDEVAPDITRKELNEYKRDMMITALFEKFFTPIDDSLLAHDLARVNILSDELNLQMEDIQAEYRLSHPNGSYYKEKDEEGSK